MILICSGLNRRRRRWWWSLKRFIRLQLVVPAVSTPVSSTKEYTPFILWTWIAIDCKEFIVVAHFWNGKFRSDEGWSSCFNNTALYSDQKEQTESDPCLHLPPHGSVFSSHLKGHHHGRGRFIGCDRFLCFFGDRHSVVGGISDVKLLNFKFKRERAPGAFSEQ